MTTQIYELLSKVAEDCDVVGKNRKNEQQGFKFRGIEDVMNAVHASLTKHGVSIVPSYSVHKREERQTAKGGTLFYTILEGSFTFFAPDGSNIKAGPFIGEGMDSGDKSCNKAMSAAYKYALTQTLSMPFAEIDDGDAHGHTVAPRQQAPKPVPQPPVETIKNGKLAPEDKAANAAGFDRPKDSEYATSLPPESYSPDTLCYVGENKGVIKSDKLSALTLDQCKRALSFHTDRAGDDTARFDLRGKNKEIARQLDLRIIELEREVERNKKPKSEALAVGVGAPAKVI